MWQKMVNPGLSAAVAHVPGARPEEIEKKISELEAVEHWLKANLNMLGLTIKSLQYQRAMLKGGEKFREEIGADRAARDARGAPGENPATWAWNMMADAGKTGIKAAQAAAPKPPGPRKKKKKA
jgi:hypothetical protein